jgi:hypothetical protein
MKTGQHTIRLIGRREFVDFPDLGLNHIEAKIDTGAYTSSLHAENIHVREADSIPMLFFTVETETDHGVQKREYAFTNFSKKIIKNSFGEMESRYIIKTLLKIGRKNIRASISLTNRWNMRYQVLIGRKPLKGKFLIDVKQLYLGGQKAGIALGKMKA